MYGVLCIVNFVLCILHCVLDVNIKSGLHSILHAHYPQRYATARVAEDISLVIFFVLFRVLIMREKITILKEVSHDYICL